MSDGWLRSIPAGRWARAEERLRAVDWRRPYWETVGRAEGRLQSEGRHLQVLSPQRTLERGYAVVAGPDGMVLRSVAGLAAGDTIRARLAAGRVTATVVEVDPADRPGPDGREHR